MSYAEDDSWDFVDDGVHNETEKRIEKVKGAIQQLDKLEKEIMRYNSLNGVIFTMEEETVAQLKKNITGMLKHYMELLRWTDVGLPVEKGRSIGTGARTAAFPVQTNTPICKTPPAYKADIDTEKIYQLRQQGKSMRAIARELKCSPDTVKRRLAKRT